MYSLAKKLGVLLLVALTTCALFFYASAAHADQLFTTYYGGTDGYCGQTMANGEPYDCSAFTAASNVYALGTQLLVCYEGCVEVVVTDRCGGCGLDLSMAAAEVSGIMYGGPGLTEITVL